MISLDRPITSTFKYLVFLIICGTAACGDDTPANTNDTASLADTSALSDVPDTSNEIDAVPFDVAEAGDTIGRPDTTGGTGVTTDPAAVSTSTVDGHSRTLIDAASSAIGHTSRCSRARSPYRPPSAPTAGTSAFSASS